MLVDNILSKSYKDHNLKDYTTLKIGGNAQIAFFPSNVEELKSVRNYLSSNNMPVTIIGAGSNLLISSKGVSGGTVFTSNFKNVEILESGKVKVGCGLKSSTLAKMLLDKNLTGLEFLVGIPGSLGGAVTMNSSAHGQAIENSIQNVEVYDLDSGNIITLNKDDLKLEYRNSFVQHNKHFILNATFQLEKGDNSDISEKMNFHVNYRKQNHPPYSEYNAGSTFRNPTQGIYVGKMLQELNAKTWQEGRAKISEKHANFIINADNATSLDVSRLMFKMYESIKNTYGYDLIAEIRYIGNPTEEEEKIWKSFQVH